jgi:hypothetical protein
LLLPHPARVQHVGYSRAFSFAPLLGRATHTPHVGYPPPSRTCLLPPSLPPFPTPPRHPTPPSSPFSLAASRHSLCPSSCFAAPLLNRRRSPRNRQHRPFHLTSNFGHPRALHIIICSPPHLSITSRPRPVLSARTVSSPFSPTFPTAPLPPYQTPNPRSWTESAGGVT